jgi:hypothetical protein
MPENPLVINNLHAGLSKSPGKRLFFDGWCPKNLIRWPSSGSAFFDCPTPLFTTPFFVDNPSPENRNRIFLADAVSPFFREIFSTIFFP